ncbi:MAG TPA: radical SAM protein [Planctomycetota bacterium]|nr:radical SAM protein [Planctomycetota bacterium]
MFAARDLSGLTRHLEDLGARAPQVRRLLRAWLEGVPLARAHGPDGVRPARELEQRLGELQADLDGLVRELERHPARDGSARLLLALRTGSTVETVELPRAGVCVSTQVGCAVGCRFCKTGESGLLQQLSSLELLAQVAHVRRARALRRVVFMGMGEPAHNLSAVLDAIAALGTHGRLPHKNLVFSTVGEPAVFEQLLAHPVRPALALSLHTLDDALRAELLPRAPRVAVDTLLDAALDFADRTTYPLLVQWTVLADTNDGEDEARALAERLAGRRAIVNYIPFNTVEGNGWRRPGIERCVALVRAVRARGVLATLRRSAGQDVDGGCGQLRSRASGHQA